MLPGKRPKPTKTYCFPHASSLLGDGLGASACRAGIRSFLENIFHPFWSFAATCFLGECVLPLLDASDQINRI